MMLKEFRIVILMLWPLFLFGQSADYIIHYDFSCVKDTTTLEHHPLDKYMLYKVGHISRFIHADRYNKDSLTAIFLEENPDPSLSGLPMTQKDVDLFTSKVHEHRAKYNIKIPSDIRVDKNHNKGLLNDVCTAFLASEVDERVS